MLKNWLAYLKAGLSHPSPQDRVAGEKAAPGALASLQNLRPFWLRHWRKGIVGAGLVLAASLLLFPQPLVYRFLIDDVVLARRLDLLPLAVLLLGGIKVASMGANALEQYYFTSFEQEVSIDIQKTLLDHTLRLPKAFFDEQEVGYLISRLSSDVSGLRWFFSSTIVYIASSILRFIGGVIFLFYLEWRLGLATIVVLPVLVLCVRYFTGRLRALSHRSMEQHASITQRFEETLASIPLVKAFTAEQRESQRIMVEVQAGRQLTMQQSVVSSFASLLFSVVPDLARAVVLVAGAYWIIQGQWTLGSLMAFQSYLGYVYGPALFLAQANLQLQDALAALERVSTMLAVAPEETAGAGIRVDHLTGDVCFDRVSFSYNGVETVLEDISFQVAPGEHIAIVGPSGVGKTTLVSLLLQFYRPTQGEIRLDGQPVQQLEVGSLRQRIGYVSQASLLLAGTIRENLVYGNPGAAQHEIEAAAKMASIHDFILSLPEGYNTQVGERGINFSEGQKQRLSIARALIKQPDILVLDEPTSALDITNEKSILEILPDQAREKTLFIISHRLSTLTAADRVFVLNDKHLTAAGAHDQLLTENAYYRSVFQETMLVSESACY